MSEAARVDRRADKEGWLGLAAAPIFALMALWTARVGGRPDGLCAMGAAPIGDMTLMYLLMSGLHIAPWLRLLRRRS